MYFSRSGSDETAAVNQHGAVAFKPLLLLQAGHQLFDCRLIASD
jgi:hypothetical protein